MHRPGEGAELRADLLMIPDPARHKANAERPAPWCPAGTEEARTRSGVPSLNAAMSSTASR
ncbi:hypothetical protein ACFQ0G_17540 [Streptomyces chiangmaiensis]